MGQPSESVRGSLNVFWTSVCWMFKESVMNWKTPVSSTAAWHFIVILLFIFTRQPLHLSVCKSSLTRGQLNAVSVKQAFYTPWCVLVMKMWSKFKTWAVALIQFSTSCLLHWHVISVYFVSVACFFCFLLVCSFALLDLLHTFLPMLVTIKCAHGTPNKIFQQQIMTVVILLWFWNAVPIHFIR